MPWASAYLPNLPAELQDTLGDTQAVAQEEGAGLQLLLLHITYAATTVLGTKVVVNTHTVGIPSRTVRSLLEAVL